MSQCFHIVTLGCKVNSYESEAVREDLIKHGLLEDDLNPDVVIINTCSVTSVSDQKSRQKIRSLIKKYPQAIMIVMGCYSQIASNTVKDIEGVDIVIGTSYRHRIWELLKEFQKNHQPLCLIEKNNRSLPYEDLEISFYHDNTRAFLKIEDGCDNFCSYCIIPYSRGGVRSRSPQRILAEVDRLVEHGFQEIVLTGIHTGGYGKDLENYPFSQLVADILDHNHQLKRLRISSIEESEIDDRLISLIRDNPRIASHLHIPLQSGSEAILKRMNRKYNKEHFLMKLERIRQARKDIAITTDIIVGFPGESEEEFQETLQFARECSFANIHVFPFSSRSGTVASTLKDQVDPAIKKERVNRLLQLAKELESQYEELFIGQEVEVLFEDYDPLTKIARGHTSNYLLVSHHSDVDLHNQLKRVIYSK